MLGQKEKSNTRKITIKLEEINQKVMAKEGKLKRYQQKAKQYQQNRIFKNNERKFCQQVGGDGTLYLQSNERETEQFWSKLWQPREDNKKAEWISNMAKEFKGLEEGLKAEIHIDLLKTTLKKYQIGKCLAMMEYMDSGSRNSPPFMID